MLYKVVAGYYAHYENSFMDVEVIDYERHFIDIKEAEEAATILLDSVYEFARCELVEDNSEKLKVALELLRKASIIYLDARNSQKPLSTLSDVMMEVFDFVMEN